MVPGKPNGMANALAGFLHDEAGIYRRIFFFYKGFNFVSQVADDENKILKVTFKKVIYNVRKDGFPGNRNERFRLCMCMRPQAASYPCDRNNYFHFFHSKIYFKN